MGIKQNQATLKQKNDIEYEIKSYMTSIRQYKCPTCKHAITITSADFIKGIAMTSCDDCGRNAFAIEDFLLN
jgi:transcription elongation factor Elf1